MHLEGLDEAAERHHVGDSRHCAQVALDHPVLEGAQLARIAARPHHAIAIDLADRGGERLELGLDPGR
jgi:hypothetical protein